MCSKKMALWAVCSIAGLAIVPAPAHASQMICKITILIKTGEIIDVQCTGSGDQITARYSWVLEPSAAAAPVSIYSDIRQFTSGMGTRHTSNDKDKIGKVARKLRDRQFTAKLRKALAVAGKNHSESEVVSACSIAAGVVLDARILRDGIDPGHGWVGLMDPTFMAFGRPRIFVEGDMTDAFDREWSAHPGAPEPGGGLGNVLLHEGLHACMFILGIPGNEQHDIMDPIGGFVPRCASHWNQTCDWRSDESAWQDEKPVTEPTTKLQVPLLRMARQQLVAGLKPGVFIRDTRSGEEGVVFGGVAFRIPADISPSDLAAINYDPTKVVPLWDDPFSDIHAPKDGTLLQEPGGPIKVFVGGAAMPVTNVESLRVAGYTNAKPHVLWKGALEGFPSTPRDGTVVWEYNSGPQGTTYVIYGGARFKVPNSDVFKSMGYGSVSIPRLWEGATDGLDTIPRDDTLLVDPAGDIWVIRNRARYHVPDVAAVAQLGLDARNIRPLWMDSFHFIPDNNPDCEMSISLTRVDVNKMWVGARMSSVAFYTLKNTGTLPSWPALQLIAYRDGRELSRWRVRGPIAAGQSHSGSYAVDWDSPPLGTHTTRVVLARPSGSCDPTGENNMSNEVSWRVVPSPSR